MPFDDLRSFSRNLFYYLSSLPIHDILDFLMAILRRDTQIYACQCTHKVPSKSSRPEKFCGDEDVGSVEIFFSIRSAFQSCIHTTQTRKSAYSVRTRETKVRTFPKGDLRESKCYELDWNSKIELPISCYDPLTPCTTRKSCSHLPY